MAKFVVTIRAKQDLLSIGRYTEKRWGRDQRNVYLREIDGGFSTLAGNPSLGRPYDHVKEGYRVFAVGKHLIFYRQISFGIEIVRVLHERMDVPARLDED